MGHLIPTGSPKPLPWPSRETYHASDPGVLDRGYLASFGLNAPRNATVAAAFLVCSMAIGGSVFLIVQIGGPFQGALQIPRAPMVRFGTDAIRLRMNYEHVFLLRRPTASPPACWRTFCRSRLGELVLVLWQHAAKTGNTWAVQHAELNQAGRLHQKLLRPVIAASAAVHHRTVVSHQCWPCARLEGTPHGVCNELVS